MIDIKPAMKPILLAGPTASGKSALALFLAERMKGCIINADSMQVYREWLILTARPQVEDLARVPHFLYGHISLTTPYSVGIWLRETEELLKTCNRLDLRPIIVGGTGLYFRALTQGLAPIPEIPQDIRQHANRLSTESLIEQIDRETIAQIDLKNPARLRRAWEVYQATGKGLAKWRTETPAPLLPLDQTEPILLAPPREIIDARCDQRFDMMIKRGAVDEVQRVFELGFSEQLPGMKALGADEIERSLRGEISLDKAIEEAKRKTRAYVRRQETWFKKHMISWNHLCSHENFKITGNKVTTPE